MNEDLNTMLLRLVQENIQTNQQWTQASLQFLNVLGNAIREDTEFLKQSVEKIEGLISSLEGQIRDRSSKKSEKEHTMTQERYPVSFYFRHKFPMDTENPGYYLLITEEGDQLRYELFDQQWKPVRYGTLDDRGLTPQQAVELIVGQEGISDYLPYEMLTERVLEKTQVITADIQDNRLGEDELKAEAVPETAPVLDTDMAIETEKVAEDSNEVGPESENKENTGEEETFIGKEEKEETHEKRRGR